MEKELLAGKKARCVVDQYRTFLFVDDALQAISQLIERTNLKGLFHLGGPEKASRWQFAEKVCAILGTSSRLIEKIHLADSASPAPRPPDCSLNSSKIVKSLDLNLKAIQQAVDLLCVPTQNRIA
jgi:dTDP-4-dehydrorhamnose reductase